MKKEVQEKDEFSNQSNKSQVTPQDHGQGFFVLFCFCVGEPQHFASTARNKNKYSTLSYCLSNRMPAFLSNKDETINNLVC